MSVSADMVSTFSKGKYKKYHKGKDGKKGKEVIDEKGEKMILNLMNKKRSM